MVYTFDEQVRASMGHLKGLVRSAFRRCRFRRDLYSEEDLLHDTLLRACEKYPPAPKEGFPVVAEDYEAFRKWFCGILKVVCKEKSRQAFQQSRLRNRLAHSNELIQIQMQGKAWNQNDSASNDATILLFQLAHQYDPQFHERTWSTATEMWVSAVDACLSQVRKIHTPTLMEERVLGVLEKELISPGSRNYDKYYSPQVMYDYHFPKNPAGRDSFCTTYYNLCKKLLGLGHTTTSQAG